MNKKDKKDHEQLSAYIDGELSPDEKQRMEEKINSSLNLQKKLTDLKKIKSLTSSSYKGINESPYFETRLFAELASRKPFLKRIKKWMPAIVFAFAAIVLMIVLKADPHIIDNLIEKQKTNIAGFYKENLKPLLFAADLSNEDIFNFAMYRKLPLDKENNQYLELGYDTTGNQYFEIKKIAEDNNQNNYQKFIAALELNEKQKEKIDSIIKEYADELNSQILVNENNTVAINANLWDYQKALLTDLMIFAETSNRKKFREMVPHSVSFTNNSDLFDVVHKFRKKKSKSYIILTPDSIFSEDLDVNTDEIKNQLKELQITLEGDTNKIKSFSIKINYDSTWQKLGDKVKWNSNFKISVDTNRCRVDLSGFFDNKNSFNTDSLNAMLDSLTKNFKSFSMVIPKIEHFDNKIKFYFDGDSSKSFEFKYQEFDIDSLMEAQRRMLDSLPKLNWKEFYFEGDSLLSEKFPRFKDYFKEFEYKEDIREQMRELREELRKFREEMRKWQEELRRQKKQKTEEVSFN